MYKIAPRGTVSIYNNTFVETSATAIRVLDGATSLSNNIFWIENGFALSVALKAQAGFSSDYNLYHLTNGARLVSWSGQQIANRVDWFYELGLGEHGLVVEDDGDRQLGLVGSAATTAPLNPSYRGEEFNFYLSDLKPKLLVVDNEDSPAAICAQDLGINIARLSFQGTDPAGTFELLGDANSNTSVQSEFAEADDISLVLHTSGTTSRPKLVP